MVYFNTTNEINPKLEEYKSQNSRQEVLIRRLFIEWKKMSPSSAMTLYNSRHPSIPLTSVRRAITCLTDNGFLTKTKEKCIGIYGRKEHLWEIRDNG